MNAFTLLKRDHERISHLIAKLEVTTERTGKYRAELFDQLRLEVLAHMKIEEETFYPALRDFKPIRSLSAEAMEEHAALKFLLEELASIPVHSTAWAAKFEVLRENLLLHAQEKEKNLFPKVRRALSPEDWENLGSLVEEAKLRVSTPFPQLVPSL